MGVGEMSKGHGLMAWKHDAPTLNGSVGALL